MTAGHRIDVSHLPVNAVSNEAPLWWGQVFLCCIEGTLLATLFAMYYYTRLSMDVWPPPGISSPMRFLPALGLMLLIASCAGSYIASQAAKKDDRGGMVFGLLLNFGLATCAMILRAIDWSAWNFKWTATAYGSIVWGILFIHTVDVTGDLAFTLVLAVVIVRGRYGPRQRQGVHVDSVVWYFLVAVWIPLYVTVYWGPVLVGTSR